MKGHLLVALGCFLVTAGLACGQTASFSFNDNNGTPDAGTYNPTDTFTVNVLGTATGFTATGYSLWLEVPATNGFSAAIKITASTVFQFTDKTQGVYPKLFTDPSGQRSIDYLTDKQGALGGDLGASSNSPSEDFTGTAILASYTVTLTNAPPGTYLMYTVANNPKKSGFTDTFFNFLTALAVPYTITVTSGPTPTPTPSPTPTTLGNISTRLAVQTGDNVLIGGFIITGTQPKKVILRAIGPSLANANPPVPGALADPLLILNSATGTLATNDNWIDAPNKQEIIDSTVAPTDNLESAILTTLDPGAYTAIVEGVNNSTGVGLVEAYDLDTAADSKLANISTRGLVQTGDDVLIGGFIVLGSTPQKVIVRAIGPSLGNANPPVPGALTDPTLELHNPDGSILASNDNWRDLQEAEIIASTIPPTDDRESAIVATLPPNDYTAIVRGANATTGVALVEVYALSP